MNTSPLPETDLALVTVSLRDLEAMREEARRWKSACEDREWTIYRLERETERLLQELEQVRKAG